MRGTTDRVRPAARLGACGGARRTCASGTGVGPGSGEGGGPLRRCARGPGLRPPGRDDGGQARQPRIAPGAVHSALLTRSRSTARSATRAVRGGTQPWGRLRAVRGAAYMASPVTVMAPWGRALTEVVVRSGRHLGHPTASRGLPVSQPGLGADTLDRIWAASNPVGAANVNVRPSRGHRLDRSHLREASGEPLTWAAQSRIWTAAPAASRPWQWPWWRRAMPSRSRWRPKAGWPARRRA